MRTKFTTLLAVAFSLGVVQAASAADMPTKAPIIKTPMATPFTWTGCYAGIQGGYKFGSTTPHDPISGNDWTTNFNFNGFVGGGTLGCNYQVGTWVFGVEGDGVGHL